MQTNNTVAEITQDGHDPARNKHHCAALLRYFREEILHNLPIRLCPSTVELTRDGRFGIRPPNRINDLLRGKFDGHRYDFEKQSFGGGVYRWKLHEPNRPGYPKDKNQNVLSLDEQQGAAAIPNSEDWFERLRGPRPSSSPGVEDLPLFEGARR